MIQKTTYIVGDVMKGKRTLKDYIEIIIIATRLGLTSFGGPTAHLGYFHDEYVRKRKWLDEKAYADLVALCQFLPGPASSQVGIGIGIIRGGAIGGILAFLGFTLPSVLALILFALLLQKFDFEDASFIHGLKIVAVVVVANAILGMAKKLTPDLPRKAIALFSVMLALLWQSVFTQVGIILVAAVIGFFLFKQKQDTHQSHFEVPISRKTAFVSLFLFFGLLIVLPIANDVSASPWLAMVDSFYRSGALVFGGGHVVLPLLEREFVPTGLLTEQQFLAGYGAAQAVPGPLFTFAAYIGAVIGGWKGGLLAMVAIFTPAFLLIFGTLPFWGTLRSNRKMKSALMGVNAAVVGLLIAAFYSPIWTSSIMNAVDFAFAALLFSLLVHWKVPSWIIVLVGAIGGVFIGML